MLQNQSVPGNRRARRSRKVALKFGAAFAATMILAGGITSTSLIAPPAAHAVAEGAGLGTGSTFVGAFMHSDGTQTYCAELGKLVVLGNNPTMNEVPVLPAYSNPWLMEAGITYNNIQAPALSGSGLTTLNYVLSHWGTTNDNAQAAAVQMAIWQIRSAGASQGYMDLLAYYKNTVGNGVVNRANQMIAEAQNANAAVSQPGDPRINTSSPYAGSVTVDPGTTSLTIENAVFTQTGTNKITFSGGTSSVIDVPFVGVPPHNAESWDRHYTITVNGTYNYEVSGGGVKYGNPGGFTDQGIVSAGPAEKRTGNYKAVAIDPDTIWSPVLSTAVPSEFVEKGEAFSDTVTFSVAENSNEWRNAFNSQGEVKYAPVTATGTLYGPFKDDPALNPSGLPPEGAPVAATANVTTDTNVGPGTYEVDSGNTKAEKSGYYSWVWDIAFDDQASSVVNPSRGDASLPENYFFTDGFGQVTEGQTVAMTPKINTQLDRDVLRLPDLSVRDLVSIDITNGEWLNDVDGNPIPVNVRLTTYGTDAAPEQQPTPPADAVQIGNTVMVEVADNEVTSEPIVISRDEYNRHEALTVQACVFKEDQPEAIQPYFNEACDDWGVPSETADIEWVPELSTLVSTRFIDVGEAFNDQVTFFNQGLSVEESAEFGWRKKVGSDDYLRVVANGTLYGPFDRDPVDFPSNSVPTWAEGRIAAEETIVTTNAKGPGTYKVESDEAREAGYYTWVWDIDQADQSATVKRTTPVDYFFTDGFGTEGESNIVSTTLELSTDLDTDEVTLMDLSVADEVQARLLDGQWLMGKDGKRIPANVRLTVYGDNGELRQQSNAPESAAEIARGQVTLDQADTPVVSDPITIPIREFLKYDHLTVQACVVTEDQPEELRGFMREVCDDYGVPAESALLVKPEVTTQAQETASIYSNIHDVAKLSKTDVPEGSTIDFTAYLKPEVGQPQYDESWNPIVDQNGEYVLWTEEELSNPAAVCEAQPVGKTERVEVSKMGEYTSPEIFARSEGTVYWVEELFVNDPENPSEEVSVHRGECGLPNETTIVEKPEVTTQALENGAVKGDIYDVAFVEGATPDVPTSVDFTAFLKPEAGQPKYDENWKPVLGENGEAVLWTEAEVVNPEAVCEAQPVGKTERVPVDGPGEYTSPTIRAETEGTVYWVEELISEDPVTGEDMSVHRGKCGLPNETTEIEYPNVTTKAKESVFAGGNIWDIAIVDGVLSEREEISYEVTFEAYHRAEGTTTGIDEALCTVDTKVWESTKPTEVTTAGEYRSEKWKTNESHIGEILWVETLTEVEKTDEGESRTEIHRGACGEVNEITDVKPVPELAITGNVASSVALAAGGALLLGGAVVFALARMRKMANAVDAERTYPTL